MIKPDQFMRFVIREALGRLSAREPRMDGPVPQALLLGTALVESGLRALQQHKGPAMGLFQVEPRTHDDLWASWLAYRPDMHNAFRSLAVYDPTAEEMRWNLVYAAAMARLVYWRAKEPLPDLDAAGLAGYWKRHYNTAGGKGTIEKATPHFKSAIRYVQ